MTDQVFNRAQLAEAVGNDISDMAHFWMLRKFQFLEPAREQFEIIVDPWLSYCEEPSQNEIMAYNMAFTDWLLFERPYRHGKTLLEYLETVEIDNDHNLKDFRYPVQYVSRPNLDFRGFCAKVASGVVRKGDEVVALPSGKRSHVKSIVTYDGELDYAFPPQSVTLTLEDEIDVSRGDMLVHPDNMPLVGRNFEAMLVWMDEEAMDANKSFFIKQTTNTSRAHIDSIKYKVDVNTMEHLSIENGKLTRETEPMQLNQIARVVITTARELFFDPFDKNKATGSFILIDPISNNTSAVGMIVGKVEDKDMLVDVDLPTLDLPKLGIAPEHYDAVERAARELYRQGIEVKIIK